MKQYFATQLHNTEDIARMHMPNSSRPVPVYLVSDFKSDQREIEFSTGVRVERQGRDTFTVSKDGIGYSVTSETALQLIRDHVCPPKRQAHISPHDPDR